MPAHQCMRYYDVPTSFIPSTSVIQAPLPLGTTDIFPRFSPLVYTAPSQTPLKPIKVFSMVRTSPAPTLIHGSGGIHADDDFIIPESLHCGSADGVSCPPSVFPDLPPSSPLHPPSSPSAFTTSMSSDCPDYKQRPKVEDGFRLRSASFRSWVPYRRPTDLLSGSLELRFVEKALRPGGDSGLSISDVRKSQKLLSAGLKRLPNRAIEEAVLMKHACRETKRFRALASAWELKEARHFTNYINCVHQVDKEEFSSEVLDPALDNLIKFRHEAYNEELLSLGVTDAQLDSLEAEVDSRISSSEPPSSPSSLPDSPSRDIISAVASSDEE